MKKTIFSKVFLNNIIIITISFMVLIVSGGFLISDAIDSDRDATVEETAHAIRGFLGSGIPPERVEHFLYGISQSTKNSILLVNKNGEIALASVNDQLYNTDARTVPKEKCAKVMKGETVKVKGNLGGVYKESMITYQFPYKARRSNEVTGAIFISMPESSVQRASTKLFNTLLMAIILVVFLSFALSYALSRRISRPIREINKRVKTFAKGDFSSRVDSSKHCKITEIQELADTFNDMAFHMEKAEDIRNNFISDVSHELRTPMTTIGGFVDGIMDGTIPPERQNEYLVIVKDEVSRLSSLVNSFLDVTRNENEKKEIELTNFDINEIIRRTVINFEKKIVSKEISVDIIFETDPCYVKADSTLIKSVLNNLIENAIKFTDANGQIRIFVSIHQHEAVISVYNTGCGIGAEDKPFIFERFYKGDKSRSSNQKGTGIGLYIVKDIIGRHGKKISVNSVEGEFAEFTFTLDKGKER